MASASTLEDTPAKAYITQNGCRVGLIPGVAIGGRFRANGDGPGRPTYLIGSAAKNAVTPFEFSFNPLDPIPRPRH